jgi:hypothetical protein
MTGDPVLDAIDAELMEMFASGAPPETVRAARVRRRRRVVELRVARRRRTR